MSAATFTGSMAARPHGPRQDMAADDGSSPPSPARTVEAHPLSRAVADLNAALDRKSFYERLSEHLPSTAHGGT